LSPVPAAVHDPRYSQYNALSQNKIINLITNKDYYEELQYRGREQRKFFITAEQRADVLLNACESVFKISQHGGF
jgi:hypothetical protein